MNILGIESTCDETGVAIVKDGRIVLSSVLASSVALHRKYGGVVPEIAAREQIKAMIPILDQSLKDVTLTNIEAIAVSNGPGLIGSLLIGTETAKTLSLIFRKPLIAVNHLIGHVYANWLRVDSLPARSGLSPSVLSSGSKDSGSKTGEASLQFTENNRQPPTASREPTFPLVALIVSGGHTDLILMHEHGKYQWLGGTLDDACGETFDKVARLLGLGYPGGPEIERVASRWSMVTSNQKLETSYHLPRPMIDSDDFDFSFSGLKTNVLNLTRQLSPIQRVQGDPEFTEGSNVKGHVSAIAYEFQNAVIDVLITKTLKAALKFNVKSVVVGGGVAANDYLRKQFTVHCSQFNITVHFPPKKMSVDNGAMIAAAGYFLRQLTNPLELQAIPSLRL